MWVRPRELPGQRAVGAPVPASRKTNPLALVLVPRQELELVLRREPKQESRKRNPVLVFAHRP